MGLARMQAVIDRIAAGVGELARARRAGDLDTAAALTGRRLAETGQRPGCTGNPFRPTLITCPPCPRSGNWTP